MLILTQELKPKQSAQKVETISVGISAKGLALLLPIHMTKTQQHTTNPHLATDHKRKLVYT